ncbi:Spy/CpxP family protein refolding chaperone [Psychrobacter sp. APC 3279]|uniref:Spy/CpxP family protein refolding chaperone n=1 Tax=Psychrobacter sp. APC 3279 TaxID=3035189 RepID=UPI0025B2B956|nr:Spy/CpxP family protein refolding chaperone [Psychrobacter sp. APC 3279]MDN3440683.1 Spy/CpxP family protein refolding chaperone [Psychrobacter sp. APC 3279]
MKKLLLGSVLAASSIFTVTACTSVNATTDTTPTAQMQKNHKDGMKKGEMRGPMSKLDLTATQQAQIKAIMQNKRGDRTADRAEHQAERAQMDQQIQALTNASTLNTAALNRLADQRAAKEKQRFIERVQTQHAIAQVLTAEQRAKMEQMKSERQEKGRKHSKDRKDHDKQHQGM